MARQSKERSQADIINVFHLDKHATRYNKVHAIQSTGKIPHYSAQRFLKQLEQERLQHSLLAKSSHFGFCSFLFEDQLYKQIKNKEQLNNLRLLKLERYLL